MDALTPTAGARYVLERTADARYLGRIFTPDATYEYEVAMGAEVVLQVRGTCAPPELEDTLKMIAKLTARGADKRAADGMPAWPERITRWRGPGRGG